MGTSIGREGMTEINWEIWLPVIAQILVAIGTITLAYMTWKLIREGRLGKNIDIHTRDLKEFVKRWENEISWLGDLGEPLMRKPSERTYLVEREELFEDLFNHTPQARRIEDLWVNLKKSKSDFDNGKYILYSKIKQKCREITKLDYWSSNEQKNFINDEFPKLIYRRIFTSEVYKYKINEYPRNGEIDTYGVECFNTKIGERPTKEGANELIRIHRDIFDITPYKQDIEKIKGVPDKYNEIDYELRKELEHFQLLPTIPYSCKIIKESTPTLFSKGKRGKN